MLVSAISPIGSLRTTQQINVPQNQATNDEKNNFDWGYTGRGSIVGKVIRIKTYDSGALDTDCYYQLKSDGSVIVRSPWSVTWHTYQSDELKKLYEQTCKEYKETNAKLEPQKALEIAQKIDKIVEALKSQKNNKRIG